MKTNFQRFGAGLAGVFLIFPAALGAVTGSSGTLSNRPHADQELLVKWIDGPQSHAAAVGNSSIGAEVKHNFTEIGWQRVELPSGMSVRAGMEAYHALGTVLAVEPNYAVPVERPPIPAVATPHARAADFSAGDTDQSRSRPGNSTTALPRPLRVPESSLTTRSSKSNGICRRLG